MPACWMQADDPPSVKQYMEAILTRLLVADLDLALALLLPKLRSFTHRHCPSLETMPCEDLPFILIISSHFRKEQQQQKQQQCQTVYDYTV